jgi:O-antigen/teichoic acid export membrane protein
MSIYNFQKLFFTATNLTISIIMGLIAPKLLGAQAYGQFSYISAFGVFYFQALLCSFNNAYIYHYAVEIEKKSIINCFYLGFVLLIGFVFFIFIIGTTKFQFLKDLIFPDIEDNRIVIFGSIFAIITFIYLRLFDVFDADKKILETEIIRTIGRFVVLSILFFLALKDEVVSLNNFYEISIIVMLISIVASLLKIKIKFVIPSFMELRYLSAHFWRYSKPLIYVTFIAATYSFLGKYLLQLNSGSIEQGYYNFAYTIATMPVVFISSLLMIFMTDITTAFKNQSPNEASYVFWDFVSTSLIIQLFAVGLIILLAEWVVLTIVGNEFTPAISIIYILSIFSVFHVFGVIGTAVFNAAGKNNFYAKLNVFILILCILFFVSYAMLIGFNAFSLSLTVTVLYIIRSSIIFFKCLELLELRKIRLYILMFF